MRQEWWVLRDDTAYTALLAEGYRPVREEVRHGRTWVLMGKTVEC